MNKAKRQIRKKNSKTACKELVAAVILLLAATCLLFSGQVLNPLSIRTVSSEEGLKNAYEEHVSYVILKDQSLEYTGYSKIDKNGNSVYNCYVTTDYEERYFVFLSADNSEDESGDTIETIEEYNVNGRLTSDQDLLDSIADDYDITTEEFLEQCNVSNIVVDEAGANRTQVTVIWSVLFTILILYILYLIIVLVRKRNSGGKRNEKKQQ